jgi:hypothetical protein
MHNQTNHNGEGWMAVIYIENLNNIAQYPGLKESA